jgi:membrane protease YdiL (CAAX protease family)
VTDRVLAAALLAGALLIVGWSWVTGRSLAARIAALAGFVSRPRMILGWAMGTCITYGLSALLALALLVRAEACWRMPDELRMAAWSLGLPGEAGAGTLLWLGGTLLVGMALGLTVLRWRRSRGRSPIGLAYRSPAAARVPAERLPAALLAVSAGMSEELFFRLALPLLVALVTGSALLGFALSLLCFTAAHRHQGWVGMGAVAFVGGWLTYLYLLTGALWLVAALHALIDVHALVLRPWLSDSARPRVSIEES